MKSHLTIVGVLFLIFGVLGILGACCLLAVMIIPGFIPVFTENEFLPLGILATIALVGSFFMVIFAIPDLIAGYGLLNEKSWSRILAIILGALAIINLSGFPISTAFGIYTLWVMVQPETEELLSG